MKKLNFVIGLLSLLFITNILFLHISCTSVWIEPTVDLTDIISESPATDEDLTIPFPEEKEEVKKDNTEKNSGPKKCIYLTIDDSPLNGSHHIDSLVTAGKIKTNIFMVGNPIESNKRFRRYHNALKANPFIEIYNHSYSHANHKYSQFYKNPEKVLADFEKNQTEFDILHKIARLPGRNLWQLGEHKKNYNQSGAEAAQLLANNGYHVFGWDIEWRYDATDYAPVQTVDELVQEIEGVYQSSRTFVAEHVVLLMHDQMFAKAEGSNQLDSLIGKLKESGYTFEYLSSYPIPAAKKAEAPEDLLHAESLY